MEEFKYFSKEEISQIPKASGVYCFKGKKEILYIGKAANLRERIKNHFQQPGYKDYLFLDRVEKIGCLKTNSEIEALILEAKLIKEIKPRFNVIWKDDKNYFFVAVTREDFPRIFWTHQRKIKGEKSKIKIEYVGPFVDGKALKETLKVLRKIFPFRSCAKIPKRPCLWYHLNRCLAPCFSKSEELKERAQRNAKILLHILKEGRAQVLKELKREMKRMAKNLKFEEAARIRDQIEALEKVLENAKIFRPEIEKEILNWEETEEKLKRILKIKKEILRIEAYDVSNIQGKEATASMVTFVEGKPEKSLYRRFKIKFTKKPDDISMLKECLERRSRHLEWGLPDLILIDGGKAQLNAARKILRGKFKKIKILALAKRKNELFLEGQKEPLLLKDLPREIFNLFLQLRDEAHRFAITYHRKLREKGTFLTFN